MHTFRDDYLIITLRFVSTNEESQIYEARLPKSTTSPEMRETKAYKTYLGYVTGVTPPKKARNFKKHASPKLTNVPISPEEPTRKSKRVKRPTKKSTNAPTVGVVIRDNPVMSLSKKKEKMTHETNENETGSESDQEENEEEVEDNEEEKDDEFVKTPSNSTNDEDGTNVESKVENKVEGDEDKGMDYATNQFDDDVVQGNENLDIILNQVIEDAYVTISTATKKTKVPVTSSSYSSDLASKFLNFLDISHTDAEIVSPMDVHVHHEVPSNQTPTLLTVPVLVITESSPVFTTVTPQSLPSFSPPPPQSTPTVSPKIW
ncbi:hypothetical protein Tco_0973574 [Tanacetum coccineum]